MNGGRELFFERETNVTNPAIAAIKPRPIAAPHLFRFLDSPLIPLAADNGDDAYQNESGNEHGDSRRKRSQPKAEKEDAPENGSESTQPEIIWTRFAHTERDVLVQEP